MNSEEKRQWISVGTGVFVYVSAALLSGKFGLRGVVEFLLFLAAYILMAYPAFERMLREIRDKRYFNENILIITATAGALGIGRYLEAGAVMLLFAAAGILEDKALNRSRKFIRDFVDIRPLTATLKADGGEKQVDPSELKKWHIFVVKPGEKIPVDGIVTFGSTTVDMQALTGEITPRFVKEGEKVYGGSINLTGLIECRVTRLYKDSTASRILRLVEEAEKKQDEQKTMVRRFAGWYTPVMAVAAVLIAVVPCLTFAWGQWHEWIYRGLIFLVAACPCGLLVSEPLAFLGGIAAAARHGVIVKGGQFLEYLYQADTFIFDKTGTLTEGSFEITGIHTACPEKMTEEQLLRFAAFAESCSNHPVAQSVVRAYGRPVEKKQVKSVKEQPGYGISATVFGKRVHIGNRRMAKKQNVDFAHVDTSGSVIHVVIDGAYAGYLVAEDTVKEEAHEVISWLREKRNAMIVMLTGDRRETAKRIAEELDLDYAYANLMPAGKMERLQEFMQLEGEREKIVFVGDGINDAPVLTQADVGIAMGGFGADAAVEAADIVLLEDRLSQIPGLVRLAGETVQVVKGNLILAVLIKVIVLGLSIAGLMEMWTALAADLIVMFVSLANATSIVKYPVD